MTQQEEQEIDKKCDEFCEYRRTHSNGYAPREWFMAGAKALDELRKPSEPETNVGEAGEELVEKIELILNENRETDRFNRTALDWRSFHSVATEIAALMQPDAWPPKPIGTTYATTKIDGKLLCVQPDKELLEAAKDALRTFYGIGCNEEAEIVQVLTKAILNYEKQSK